MFQNPASQVLILITSLLLLLFVIIIASIYVVKVKNYKSSLALVQALHEEKERTMQFAAMEVHDHFTQMLCMTRMALYVINDHAVPANKHEIDVVTQIVEKMIAASHNLIHSLYPGELDINGLISSIREEIEWFNKINESRVTFTYTGAAFELGQNNALMIFRILQEALSNAIKHGRASKISVEIAYKETSFSMLIKDNGIGFDLQKKIQSKVGTGLRNLYKRAEICEGRLEIESTINKGTAISLLIRK